MNRKRKDRLVTAKGSASLTMLLRVGSSARKSFLRASSHKLRINLLVAVGKEKYENERDKNGTCTSILGSFVEGRENTTVATELRVQNTFSPCRVPPLALAQSCKLLVARTSGDYLSAALYRAFQVVRKSLPYFAVYREACDREYSKRFIYP